jgi:internalin A
LPLNAIEPRSGIAPVASTAGGSLSLSSQPANHIFISYCHEDRAWLNEFRVHLKPFLIDSSTTSWDDEEIQSGEEWSKKIDSAIASARIAVLLVSSDFLNSEFIVQRELPLLLEAKAKRNIALLWVPLRMCAYTETAIADYQAASNPEEPLASLDQVARDKIWVTLCRTIKTILKDRAGT